MLLAIKAHPDATKLLTSKGENEETFIWQDEDTGLYCRCRPDRRVNDDLSWLPSNLLIDWKTTRSCDIRDLRQSILSYGYHIQAAFYTDGYEKTTGNKAGGFVNVFVEKSPPFRVVLGVLTETAITEGRYQYKKALTKIAQCEKQHYWPGFVDFDLPEYAKYNQ
jgi:hypothetical protein